MSIQLKRQFKTMSTKEWSIDPIRQSQIDFDNPQVSILVTETSYALKIEESSGAKGLSINFSRPFLSQINSVLKPFFDSNHERSQN